MNKKEKIFIFGLIGLFFSIVLIVAIFSIKNSIKMKDSMIEGRIDSIGYTPQGYPYIYVDGKFYDLTNYSNNQITIQTGDSIIKKKGDRTIYVIREVDSVIVKFAFD